MTDTHTLPAAELSAFSRIVDLIYEGAIEPARWPAVVPVIADWLGGRHALLFSASNPPSAGDFLFSHNISESMLQSWRAHFQGRDLWLRAVFERRLFMESNVVLGQELVSFEELIQSAWYEEFLSKADHVHLMSGAVFGLDTAALPPVAFSFYRGIADKPFEEAERARLKLMLPHLSRALGVMLRLQDAEFKVAANLAALDRLKAGVVLLNERGSVVFVNQSAKRLLAEEDGLGLRVRLAGQSADQLAADGAATAHASLTRAIREAVDPDILATPHFSRSLAVPRHSGRASYVAQFSRLPQRNEYGSGVDAPRAIMFLTDPAAPVTVDPRLMGEVYGLTPAETRTAAAVVQGGTVEEVAAALGVSENTVRTQLKQIYAKTGVDSRARLVKLVHSLASV